MMNKTPRKNIVVGQINLAGAYANMPELEEIMRVRALDLVLVQHPYCEKQKESPKWIPKGIDTRKMVYNAQVDHPYSMIITNNDFALLLLQSLSNEYFTTIQLTSGSTQIYFVSCYFKYSDDIEIHLEFLQHILNKIGCKPTIIGGDFNAHSKLWHSKDLDDKGSKLEELIYSNSLHVANKKTMFYTFSNVHGESNIDVTMTTENFNGTITDWEVIPDVSSSDHRLIQFCVSQQPNDNPERAWEKKVPRYDLRKANWSKFQLLLEPVRERLSSYPLTGKADIDVFVSKLTQEILECADQAIPKRKISARGSFVMTKRAQELKKAMNTALQKIKRAKSASEDDKVLLRMNYQSTRNEYKKEVRLIKKLAFQKFVVKHSDDPWGPVYKAATKKDLQSCLNSVVNVPTGEENIDIRDNIGTLMDTLFPNDDPTDDSSTHEQMRADAFNFNEDDFNTQDFNPFNDAPFTDEEMQATISKVKNGKAPGNDNISPEIVKKSIDTLASTLLELYNACLEHEYFPDCWKIAELTLLKKESGESNSARAYRPISLLSVLSKVLEGMLIERIMTHVGDKMSKRQNGFTAGKSTMDAIQWVITKAKNSERKYVLLIALDIKGAFDNAWWPSIARFLRQHRCPVNLYRLLASFFKDRRCRYTFNGVTVEKEVQRGCPQGSKAGPKCWNMIHDDLLQIKFRDHITGIQEDQIEAIAYADDTAIKIEADSRRELERLANQVLEIVSSWVTKHKLSFNTAKSECIMLKGNLKRRLPIIKMDGANIKFKEQIKYLGFVLDEKLTFIPHIQYIMDKGKKRMDLFRKYARKDFGLKCGALRTIYKGVFEPIITYGSPIIDQVLNKVMVVKQVRKAQRGPLLLMTKAYRTTPTLSLPLLAGVLPADLLIRERAALLRSKKEPNGNPEERRLIKQDILAEWQREWECSDKGRSLYPYIPNPSVRMQKKKLNIGFNMVQFLTEHGGTRSYITKRHPEKMNDPRCDCGAKEETFDHILEDCPLYAERRLRLSKSVQDYGAKWPCDKRNYLVHEKLWSALELFINDVMKELAPKRTGNTC